ncbi:hypothetical protein [Photobacterium damselae]|uniref:secretion/conjugation apparatus DotM-related subunit n=1 Tax=Photobacterium damselae TaxID=38293 RepID=UPI001F1D6FDD|nr:hypothetical protein [Photobacterium damselae]UKA04729.1 hypothetical protein IHC89_21040 [Photobacterium damselae subsp. damselae]
MSEEKGSLNSKTGAWIVTMLIIGIAVPYLWHHYIQPVYTYCWYWFNLYLFNGLTWLVHHSDSFNKNSDSYMLWVNWAIMDGNLKPHTMTNQILNSYRCLNGIHADTMRSIHTALVTKKGGYTITFITISRFAFAILSPLYVFFTIYVLRKIANYNQFTTVFTLDTFATTLAEGFPENLPVVWDNPLKETDLDKGHWAMSPKILKYLRDHGCIIDFSENGDEKFKLDAEATRELLVSQLGRRWTGYDDLTDEERKVMALALPMIKSPKKGAAVTSNLIMMYGYAYSGKPSFSIKIKAFISSVLKMVNPIILFKSRGVVILNTINAFFEISDGISESLRRRKYARLSKKEVNRVFKTYGHQDCVVDIVKRHAYVYTVIAALIRKARDGGKLPSCTCIWLKKKDRRLFYIFNNLGREVGWIEVVGFWSHDISERKIKVPFSYPRIDAGIRGIDEYLWGSYYEYEPIFDWDEILSQ